MVKTRLHILLAERRLTQKELSELTGIGKNTINRYCNDTWVKINKEDIDVLCKFFKCKITDLIEYVEDEN